MLRENLELIEVVYNDTGKKATLTFLDEEYGHILEVKFNKQVYDDGKYVDDEDKEKQVDEWCEEYFETTFDKLTDCVGVRKDVYKYDNFNSLWESTETKKFDIAQEGTIFETEIKRINDDGKGIHIYFDYEGDEYSSKMMYSEYVEVRKEWFVNPQKKLKQIDKFVEKFGVKPDEADSLVGKKIMVEVKVAFRKYAYCDIKKPIWK